MRDLTTTPLMEMKDVAARLGVPVASAYSMARRRILPAVKLGRLWKVDADVLESWIRNGGCALPGGWREEPAQ